jgi:hypothetical protein
MYCRRNCTGFYREIPSEIIIKARNMLPEEFLTIIDEFNSVSFA